MGNADVVKTRKKVLELIETLGRSDVSVKEGWKKTVEEYKESLNNIKEAYRKKQTELKKLVEQNQIKRISQQEFLEMTKKLQDELTELESRILNLRIKRKI